MVPKRTKSKRKTLHDKYKIQRKIVEHHRKLRKMDRQAAKDGKNRREAKDPGIPNNWPFKEELLLEAKQFKEQAELRKEQEKLRRREERSKRAKEANMNQQNHSVSVSARVDTRSTFDKLVEDSDILIETLDARDPIGSRCESLEKLIIEKNKIIIFVLTKPDLIPSSNLTKWLALLRPLMPVFVVKNILPPVKNYGVRSITNIADSSCIGDITLLQAIKSIHSKCPEKNLHIGVFGYYNTGKKQLLESLAKIAFNKNVKMNSYEYYQVEEKLFINKNIYVSIDSSLRLPSYAMPRICNVIGEIKLKSCEYLLSTYIKESNADMFSFYYNIPKFSNIDELCEFLYEKRGKSKSGIIPKDILCRQVLRDIYTHKIPSYTLPFDTMKTDAILDACKSCINDADKASIYQQEDASFKEMHLKKYKFIIDDRYINGTYLKSLQQENEIQQEANSEEEEEEEENNNTDDIGSDADLLMSDSENEDEELENDDYNFETDYTN